MQAQISLGRIFGIKIGLHYSWILIALLVTFSLAGHFQSVNSEWGSVTVWGAAVITGILFFASILVHELSHAAVAKARGLPVRSIVLFALGGVAQIEKESADAKTEFWMAILGPITSVAIGALCLAAAWALGWTPMENPATPATAVLQWLGIINIALAVFNLIPGFPLDGGRVLRAIIWWVTGDAARSTRVAARVGQVVAFIFIIWGMMRFFGGAGFGGLWLAFIGWFLLEASRSSYAQVEVSERLRGVRVADVMTRDCPMVDSNTNLQTFVDEHLLRTGQRCFIIEEQGSVAGLITPHEVREVERARWPYVTVDEVMRTLDRTRTIEPGALITEALEVMGREDLNQLPVVRSGKFEGIVTRGHILRLLQTRGELQV